MYSAFFLLSHFFFVGKLHDFCLLFVEESNQSCCPQKAVKKRCEDVKEKLQSQWNQREKSHNQKSAPNTNVAVLILFFCFIWWDDSLGASKHAWRSKMLMLQRHSPKSSSLVDLLCVLVSWLFSVVLCLVIRFCVRFHYLHKETWTRERRGH